MTKKKILQFIKYLFTSIFAFIYILPLVMVFINSFKTKNEIVESAIKLPERLNFENYITILTKSDFISSFVTSIAVVIVTTLLTVLIAAITGYALARWKSRVTTIVMLIIMTTLFVPFQVYMISMVVVMKNLSLINTIYGLIIVYIALGMPVPVFLCRSYCVGMSREIEEAAIIDGCSRPKMLIQIILPLMRPILATVAILNALWVWGEFLVAFLVYSNGKYTTLPLSQRYFYGSYSNQWNLILTNFVIASIPIIVLYIVMQKHIIKGIVAGAVKG